jgi:hypothetical protein
MNHQGDARARFRYVEAGDLANDTVGFQGLQVRSTSADEKLGTVRGFIVDEASSQLHYVVVDSGGWFSSESFLIPPAYTRVDAEQQVLWAEANRDTIRRFPPFDPREYPALSDTQLWEMERRIIEAYGDDPGVVAPSATWDRQSWSHYRQPDWWSARRTPASTATAGTLGAPDTVPPSSPLAAAAGAGSLAGVDTRTGGGESRRYDSRVGTGTTAGELVGHAHDRTVGDRPTADRERLAPADRSVDRGTPAWPDPSRERAQPGDVLGIERGGETTSLGETAEDEDQRRTTSEKEFDEIRAKDERERAPGAPGRRHE